MHRIANIRLKVLWRSLTIVLAALVTCQMAPTSMMAAERHKYTLVIDAGHGGKDAGALGKYSKEKNINLNVALAFGRYVEQNCPDVKVIYTRKTDVFIPLHERAAIANRNKADVFVSIHTNSVASKKPIAGLETYTMGMRRSDEKLSAAMRENDVILIEKDYKQHYAGFDPRSPESYIIFEMINDANMMESVELAKAIQKHVCRTAHRPNKGVRQDAFLVLRETSMPACLVELGYITTPSEEAYLNEKKNIDALGRGIYQAFVAYKAKRTGGKAPKLPADKKEEKTQDQAPEKTDTTVQTPDTISQKPQKDDTPAEAPVFKVQLMASDRQLKPGDRQLKGLKDVDSYKEGKIWKYTVGCTTDYQQIRALRKEVADKFPQAFIIAFKNGEKMDTQAAIQEYKKNKK